MRRIRLDGPAYKSSYIEANDQRNINLQLISSGPKGRNQGDNNEATILVPTPGILSILEFTEDNVRCLVKFKNLIYAIASSSAYEITIDQTTLAITKKFLGQLATSSGIVKAAVNPTQILFVDGTFGYICTSPTSASVAIGPIGGTALDTYTLKLGNTPLTTTTIYNNVNVATALDKAAMATAINAQTTTTGIKADWNSATAIFTLSRSVVGTGGETLVDAIYVEEAGTGFTPRTDGLTVTGGPWQTNVPGGSNTNGLAGAFRIISDPDFPPEPSAVAFMDGYFIVNESDTGRFWFSALNDGQFWDGLDVATAESNPDRVQGFGVAKGDLWVFGTDSSEIWYDAANTTGAPFSPRQGLQMQIGCQAANSIVQVNDTLLWLDNRGFVVQSSASPLLRDLNSGYDLRIVSTEALGEEFATYERLDDAVGMTYVDRGYLFYQITFPTENKTWVYNLNSTAWHERNGFDVLFTRYTAHITRFAVSLGTLTIVAGTGSNKLYLQNRTYYSDDGEPIRRKRISSPQYSDNLLISIDTLELKMSTGNATGYGDGSNPTINMRYSVDGGHVWSSEVPREFGKIGEYNKPVRWNRLGMGREWVVEFTIIEPIDFAIIEAFADITAEEEYS